LPTFLVALAVDDTGERLLHFGYARHFAIVEVQDTQVAQLGLRSAEPFCRQPEKDSKLETAADLLADCRALICAAAGPCARRELADVGIAAFEFDGTPSDALYTIAHDTEFANTCLNFPLRRLHDEQ